MLGQLLLPTFFESPCIYLRYFGISIGDLILVGIIVTSSVVLLIFVANQVTSQSLEVLQRSSSKSSEYQGDVGTSNEYSIVKLGHCVITILLRVSLIRSQQLSPEKLRTTDDNLIFKEELNKLPNRRLSFH